MTAPTSTSDRLTALAPGMAIVYGGDRVARVSDELAAAFRPGDRLVVVQSTGALLHVPAAEQRVADEAVAAATRAFASLRAVTDDQISAFFDGFAARLGDDATFAPIAAANSADVAAASAAGRSTTRLELTAKMRADMVGRPARLARPAARSRRAGRHASSTTAGGWSSAGHRSAWSGSCSRGARTSSPTPPACSVRGNTVVFRIGSDALGTARAIVEHALAPALAAAGLPSGAAVLLDSPSRATGWALFSNPQLALAVGRGSGTAVEQLGAVARQAGVPVSLHGTGGAWLVAGPSADAGRFRAVVRNSLDRKVCNTLNVCCIHRDRAGRPRAGVPRRPRRRPPMPGGTNGKLHVVKGSEGAVPPEWFATTVAIRRAEGEVDEPQRRTARRSRPRRGVGVGGQPGGHARRRRLASTMPSSCSTATARASSRRSSARTPASTIASGRRSTRRSSATGSPAGSTGSSRSTSPSSACPTGSRGRLFARSGILSGDSVHTVRLRAFQADPDLHR